MSEQPEVAHGISQLKRLDAARQRLSEMKRRWSQVRETF
jgi:hypothetical protein